jgi:hypothetical protein
VLNRVKEDRRVPVPVRSTDRSAGNG